MKKKSYIPTLLLGLTLAVSSCDNSMDEYLSNYDTILYFRDSGVHTLELPNLIESETVSYSVCKAGYKKETAASATITPLTAEELATYNTEKGTAYVQLANDYFTAPTDISFAASDEYKTMELTLKIADIVTDLDYKSKDYVVALQLSSSVKVNEEKSLLIIRPELTVPKILFDADIEKVQSYTMPVGSTPDPEEGELTFSYPFYLNYGDNTLDFSVYFEQNNTLLQQEVGRYNTANNTSYTLLPVANYQMSSPVNVTDGDIAGQLRVFPQNLNNLEIGNYLLPIVMSRCDQEVFEVSSDVYYISIIVERDQRREWRDITDNLTAASFSGNNWDYGWGTNPLGYRYLIDKLIGANSNFWQSAWNTAQTENREATDEYGISINVDLGKSYQGVKFSYVSFREATRALSSPSKIRFYGSTDGITWIPVSDEISNLPYSQTEQAWWQSEALTLSDKSSFKHLKLAIKQARKKDGTLVEIKANTLEGVIISEIKIEAIEILN